MLNRAFVIGVDHHDTDTKTRELFSKYSHLEDTPPSHLLEEMVVLSTCNRFEIYGVAAKDISTEHVLADISQTLPGEFYQKVGEEMLSHGFRVASSLESMVLGEPQILGQMKQAYKHARDQGSVSGFMDRFCSSALRVGKRVRSETSLNNYRVSMASLAVEKAVHVLQGLKGKKALLIGAGEMGISAGRYLKEQDAQIGVVSRGSQKSLDLSQELSARIWSVQEMQKALAWADVVVCSSSDASFVLTEALLAPVVEGRGRPLLLLDIAVPRDVAPTVKGLDNVSLYGIDDLAELAAENRERRVAHKNAADKIIKAEVQAFVEWDDSRKNLHMVTHLRDHFANVREEVLQKYKGEEAEQATRLLMNKLLHQPSCALNEGGLPADAMEKALEVFFGVECPRDVMKTAIKEGCPFGFDKKENE